MAFGHLFSTLQLTGAILILAASLGGALKLNYLTLNNARRRFRPENQQSDQHHIESRKSTH